MRILFMGTPALSAKVLSALAGAHDIVGVFTRPDAVRGRGKKLVASPVKQRAGELGLDVYTPRSLADDDAHHVICALKPEIVCVVAYGMLLPAWLLELPKHGCINVHTSLLPRWRGAAPIQRAILEDDATTGVSIMRIEEGLDTGDICIQEELPCAGRTLAQLEDDLARVGSSNLLRAIGQIETGEVEWRPQPEQGITYAQKISKSELMLDPQDSVSKNLARVRASSDAHPARAVVAGRSLTVLDAVSASPGDLGAAFGEVCTGQALFLNKRFALACADGLVELLEVKPDGKKAMDAKAFAAGLQGIKGTIIAWEKA